MRNKIYLVIAFIAGIIISYLAFGGVNGEDLESHSHEKQVKQDEIWTCSMHPQIRKPEAGDCPICGMDLILTDTKVNENPLVFEMSEDAVRIANIETTRVGGGVFNVEKGEKLFGKIKANETTTASLVTHIEGRIEKLYVSYVGEQVREGQRIATIYSANLITAQKELIEANKVREVNPKLFEATLNKLKYWKITDFQINKILKENKVMESFEIFADHNGVVQKKRVAVGDHLMEGEALFSVQDLNKLWVVFDIYEHQIAQVKVGDKIKFTTISIPNQLFEARISFINPTINPVTRTVSIRLEINNKRKNLKPEMFVEGYFEVEKEEKTILTVPKSAVLWTGTRSVVYLKIPNKKVPSFEFKEIEIGESIGASYRVLSGLKNDDEVVTKGAFVIDASAQLNNQNSMMNRLLEADIDVGEEKQEMKCESGKCGGM